MNHQLSFRTLAWVSALHMFLIFWVGFFSWPHFFPKKQTNFIELINLGSLNPGSRMPSRTPLITQRTANLTQRQTRIRVAPALTALTSPFDVAPEQAFQPPTPLPPSAAAAQVFASPQETLQLKKTPSRQSSSASRTIKVSTQLVTRKHTARVGTKTTHGSQSHSSSTSSTEEGISPESVRDALEKSLGSVGIQGGNGEGNLGSRDGETGEVALYHALIKEALLNAWKRPVVTGPQNLETFATVRIQPDGTLSFIAISTPSSSGEMDASVEEAIRAVPKLSQPLPPGVGSPDYEITINFRLN